MEFNFWSFFITNLEAAGVIGGYVSISIIGFAIITFLTKMQNKLANEIGPKWVHPIIGALLGAIPGCGASIVVASLYKNKKISFGGLFATFISTLGEGSFVLLGASSEADVIGNIKAYAIITIFGLVTGTIFGYLYDFFGLKANYLKNDNTSEVIEQKPALKVNNLSTVFIEKIGFYFIISMAIFLAPGSIMALWGGSIESISIVTYWVSIVLTITCIIQYLISSFFYKNHACLSDSNDIKSTLLHAILDVSLVITFVFIGLFFANYIIDVVVGAEIFDKWMTSSSYIVVFLAALIGLLPGCGGMISVAVAFITVPNFPISALIAASIATSGDGIFPLFAENRKDALHVSIAGFLVALLVGYLALILGF